MVAAVSRYDVLLFLHVLAAFAAVTAVVLLTTVAIGIRGGGADAAPFLRLSGLARTLWNVSGLGTLVFGVWLALDVEGYGLLDGWIIAAFVLWLVAGGTGAQVANTFHEAGRGSASGGVDLSAIGRTRVLHTVMAVAVAALLVVMIYKPGA
jgi:uncharacterized membrane protein